MKIRAGDIGKAGAKMRSKPMQEIVKVPVGTNDIAVVRAADKGRPILHIINDFYKSKEIENRMGIVSDSDFAKVKDHLMDILGEKIIRKLNIVDLRTHEGTAKNFSVTLLKWTIPVLKYLNKPIDCPERDIPALSITIEDLVRLAKMMKKMGADLPSRQQAEELTKDAEVKKLLASHNMDKLFIVDNNAPGAIALQGSTCNGTFADGKLEEKMAVLFVRLEREHV